MAVSLNIPTSLRTLTLGQAGVLVTAGTVAEALNRLMDKFD